MFVLSYRLHTKTPKAFEPQFHNNTLIHIYEMVVHHVSCSSLTFYKLVVWTFYNFTVQRENKIKVKLEIKLSLRKRQGVKYQLVTTTTGKMTRSAKRENTTMASRNL